MATSHKKGAEAMSNVEDHRIRSEVSVLRKIPKIDVPKEEIDKFCSRWNIAELSVFGSVLRDDFGPDSDIDLVIDFEPKAKRSLLILVRMERELGEILGRRVDIIVRASIENSRNHLRRREILGTMEKIYGK